jgi:5'-methylthioadenosine phosphorylase
LWYSLVVMPFHPEGVLRGVSSERRFSVIGGTGFSERATDFETIHTDYGPVRVGHLQLAKRDTIFLARHQHLEGPSAVNYRANVQALKLLGVDNVALISAAGRMAEEIVPGNLVAVDDLVYFGLGRRPTSFGEEGALLLHAPSAAPFSQGLREVLAAAWEGSRDEIERLYAENPQLELQAKLHNGGTYFNSEPPWFNTAAQEEMIRGAFRNVKLIGQTLLPESTLLREMGIAQMAVAMCTDHSTFPGAVRPVTHAGEGGVMDVATITSQAALILLNNALVNVPEDFYDEMAHDALRHSIHPDQINWGKLRMKRPRLAVIIDQALPENQRQPYNPIERARYFFVRK